MVGLLDFPRAALQSKWTLQLYRFNYEGCAGTAVTPHCRVSETSVSRQKPDTRELREGLKVVRSDQGVIYI